MKKEFIKVIAVTALCIGVFCAGFIGINHFALASAMDGTDSIQPMTTSVAVPLSAAQVTENALWGGFQTPDLTVSVLYNGNTPSANALSPEDAAQIGARYVWDMFGECMDGKYVGLWYADWTSQIRRYWVGQFAESEEAFYNSQLLFMFFIDAVTGERIDINVLYSIERCDEHDAMFARAREDGSLLELRTSIGNDEVPEQLNEYIEAATEIASRHFINTEVVNVEFLAINASNFGFDENGNIIGIARQLSFRVTDNTGRTAYMSIYQETKTLRHLHTQHNDIIPGFAYVRNEVTARYTHVIEHGRIRFTMENIVLDDITPRQQDASLEAAAKIAADVILEQFDISVHGMDGHMRFFVGQDNVGAWTIFIHCAELTAHDDNGDDAFYMGVNAETGEVLWLYMNTPETPFHG